MTHVTNTPAYVASRPEGTAFSRSGCAGVVGIALAALAVGLGVGMRNWRLAAALGAGSLVVGGYGLWSAYRTAPARSAGVPERPASGAAGSAAPVGPENEMRVGQTVVRVIEGDIIQRDVDVIVNAANSALAGGSGVDAAIERAAGRAPYEECARNYGQGIAAGSAVWSGAGNLSPGVKGIVHAVGPALRTRGAPTEAEAALLRGAYTAALEVADEHRAASMALPFLSTGIFGYPMNQAAPVAIKAIHDYLVGKGEATRLREIRFMVMAPALPHLLAAVRPYLSPSA